jgi:predicted CxxxxCH...CXXCH cytochrome family protein
MKSMSIKWILLLPAAALVFHACSDPQDAPTAVDNEVSVHGANWLNKNSSEFHGTVLAQQNYNAEDCRPCHGNQYDGGVSGVSCYTCHASYPHPASGWVAGAGAHYVFLKNNGYDLLSCTPCHGQNYDLVKVNNSCVTCHSQPGGPEACNTCHGNGSGNPADLINSAPPEGLDGETASNAPAVGAHQAHFAYFKHLPAGEVCQECHVVPNDFSDPGHVKDDNRAEPLFNGPLGNLITEGGSRVPQVVYDFNTNTCSNSYCHGNWGLRKSQSNNDFVYAADVMTGGSAAPNWTNSGAAPCGSCHGLPPTGHNPFPITACTICHQGVVDGFGVITDSTKHMNGKVNIYQEEYPMF